MKMQVNRRRHPRYSMPAPYTPICVRAIGGGEGGAEVHGHVYDISEGGVRFELDELVEPGTKIAMQITLPEAGGLSPRRSGSARSGSTRADAGEEEADRGILVLATVVWVEDEDEPGPVRTAAIIDHFARAGDKERLLRQFSTGRYRLAA